jgi:hypothetical protein
MVFFFITLPIMVVSLGLKVIQAKNDPSADESTSKTNQSSTGTGTSTATAKKPAKKEETPKENVVHVLLYKHASHVFTGWTE